jgi:plasmid stabilization system protein ParE
MAIAGSPRRKNRQNRPTRFVAKQNMAGNWGSDIPKETIMPRGSKDKYSEKQKRQAEHIEEGYEERGVPEKEAERRAWATVNKMTGGGKKPGGSGRGKGMDKAPAKKGGRLGGMAAARRPAAERSKSAKKAARTRARKRG